MRDISTYPAQVQFPVVLKMWGLGKLSCKQVMLHKGGGVKILVDLGA